MELSNIEELLVKYENGNTSVEEERILQHYFSSETVPAHLKEYKSMFGFTTRAREHTYKGEVLPAKKRRNFTWIGIAASILILIGIYGVVNDPTEELSQQSLGTIEDPEEAYLKARETLLLVSQAFNTGKEDLTYVEEFDKAKNKYIKE